jgi:diketogulonate reductase-like aldo/keto reductase
MRKVRLPDQTDVPALGQGTWFMGEGRRPASAEADALRLGIDLGMTLIDTAEMYGDGGAEKVVAAAIAGQRDKVFLVSKVYPHNASRSGVAKACERSLQRLRTDRLDLYLLHWRGSFSLSETVEGFEALKFSGKIGAWGVSNFDTSDMEELVSVPHGDACVVDQVLYNPEHRGIEHDLMPWCVDRRMALMAYSPIGQGGRLLRAPSLAAIAARHGATPAQIALAWGLRHPHVICIPKAADPEHVRQNAAAQDITLSVRDLAEIDAAFPPPRRKQPLAML